MILARRPIPLTTLPEPRSAGFGPRAAIREGRVAQQPLKPSAAKRSANAICSSWTCRSAGSCRRCRRHRRSSRFGAASRTWKPLSGLSVRREQCVARPCPTTDPRRHHTLLAAADSGRSRHKAGDRDGLHLYVRHSGGFERPSKADEFADRTDAFRTAFDMQYQGKRIPLELGSISR
jgi:hypothetical protein